MPVGWRRLLWRSPPTSTLIHEGEVDAASYYVKQDPAIVSVDGEESETEFSGKAGLGLPISDALSAYGEVSFLTAEDEDDFGLGGKIWV